MGDIGLTLSRHILAEQKKHPEIGDDLSSLIAQLGYAGKILAREMRRAALVGKLGLVGDRNATGDNQKVLDVYSNEVFLDAFGSTGVVAAMASEEMADIEYFPTGERARYVLCTDPLDGSSNTDINGSLGTIFGFFRRTQSGSKVDTSEILRRGSEMVLAGYILYSTSTVLVYTTGNGVHGFTLDHDLGEFLLSHPDIHCPKRGHSFSTNLGRLREWSPGIQDYVAYLTELDKPTGRPYSLRYSGALVADLHRCLVEGGLYFYPADAGHPDGKLRLVYECAPLAFVVAQAGGSASSGTAKILDIPAKSLHQKTQIAIGSAEEVETFERFASGTAVHAGKTTA